MIIDKVQGNSEIICLLGLTQRMIGLNHLDTKAYEEFDIEFYCFTKKFEVVDRSGKRADATNPK